MSGEQYNPEILQPRNLREELKRAATEQGLTLSQAIDNLVTRAQAYPPDQLEAMAIDLKAADELATMLAEENVVTGAVERGKVDAVVQQIVRRLSNQQPPVSFLDSQNRVTDEQMLQAMQKLAQRLPAIVPPARPDDETEYAEFVEMPRGRRGSGGGPGDRPPTRDGGADAEPDEPDFFAEYEAFVNELLPDLQSIEAALGINYDPAGNRLPDTTPVDVVTPDELNDLMNNREEVTDFQQDLNNEINHRASDRGARTKDIRSLRSQYFENKVGIPGVEPLLQRIDAALFRAWEVNLDTDPRFEPLRDLTAELSVAWAVAPGTPEVQFNSYRTRIAELQAALATAHAVLDNDDLFSADDATREKQKAVLRTRFTTQVDTKIRELEAQALAYWTANIEVIHPELAILRNALEHPETLVLAEGETQLSKIKEAMARALDAINGVGYSETYKSVLQERYFAKGERETGPALASFWDVFNRIKVTKYIDTKEQSKAEDALSKLDEAFQRLRETGLSSERLSQLEFEVQRLKFVTLKGTVIATYVNTENNEDGAGVMDTLNNQVIGPLLEQLKGLLQLLPADQKPRFEAEYKRFKEETDLMIHFYMAAKVIRGSALGLAGETTSSTEPMKLPSSSSVYVQGWTNDKFGTILRGELGRCEDPDLRHFAEEEVNPFLEYGANKRQVQVLNPETMRYEPQEVETTVWGESMRLLDLFFQGLPPQELSQERRLHYVQQRRTFYMMTGTSVHNLLNEFDKAIRRGKGDPNWAEPRISYQQALRAFNMSVMLYRPFVLAPSSFDKAAPAYYSFRPDYALGEVIGATSNISALTFFSIFGFTTNNPDVVNTNPADELGYNPQGVDYTLEAFSEKPHAHGFFDRVANMTMPGDIRRAVHVAFDKMKIPPKFHFLQDLPLAPLPIRGMTVDYTADITNPKRRGMYVGFIDPLSNMVLRNNSGIPVRIPTAETSVRSRFFTFNDHVDLLSRHSDNPNGSVIYELLPFAGSNREVGEDEELTDSEDQELREQYSWWVNQAKNVSAFYESILTAKPNEMASQGMDKITALAKDIKYVLALLEPYGLELHYRGMRQGPPYNEKTFKIEALKMQLILTVAFIQGALMMGLEGKSANEVKKKFAQYNINITTEPGETSGDALKEGMEAVFVALEAAFENAAFAREFVHKLSKELEHLSFDR